MGRMRPDEKTQKSITMLRECLQGATYLQVARKTGLNPSHLYRAFGGKGNPCVSTFFLVADALEIDVQLVPRDPVAKAEDAPAPDVVAAEAVAPEKEPEADAAES